MPRSNVHKQLLISFSGMDGCGKSTQIENLRLYFTGRGMQVKLLAFWDDVVVFTGFREGFVHKVFGSEPGIGSPDRPVRRRDKNVRSWYLSLLRHGLYLLDALHLGTVIAGARRSDADVIILDRYIYDELANLPLFRATTKIFIRIVDFLAPHPDVAYLLDAEPEVARARKPEYPVDFLHTNRRAYLELAHMLGRMTIIQPLPLPQAVVEVERALAAVLNEDNEPAATLTPSAGFARGVWQGRNRS